MTKPGSSTLSGTTTVNAVGGVVTFTGLSLNRTGFGYTFTVSAAGLASFTTTSTNVLNVAAAAASQLVVTAQPASTPRSTPPSASPLRSRMRSGTW